jgi:hypothetical protein
MMQHCLDGKMCEKKNRRSFDGTIESSSEEIKYSLQALL